MHKTRIQDLVIGLIVVALGVFMWIQTVVNDMEAQSRSFSRFVLGVFILLGAILIVISLINARKPAGKEVTIKEFKNPMIMFAIIVAYAYLMTLIGFFPATLLFMPAAMIYMGYKRILPMVCVTIGMNLFIWVLFVYSLKVRLPKGASFMSFLRFLYQ